MENCITEMHEKIREKLINSAKYKNDVEKASVIFSLLGDPSRMKIILALMEGELCVYHICEITGAKQSSVSQHLRKLKDNNIVKCRKSANQVVYYLADEHVSDLVKTVLQHLDCK